MGSAKRNAGGTTAAGFRLEEKDGRRFLVWSPDGRTLRVEYKFDGKKLSLTFPPKSNLVGFPKDYEPTGVWTRTK